MPKTRKPPKSQQQFPWIAESLQPFAAPIDSLAHDPANARKHPDRNILDIQASLKAFGQQTPIVVDADGIVRKGNGTLAAARKLGWSHLAVITTKLTGAKLVAYGIADNRSSETSSWDEDALARLLAEIQKAEDIEARATGFDDAEIDRILREATGSPTVAEDEVPEPPTEPRTQRGDVWLLGPHRLLCGDSTKQEDVARVMDGRKADLWLTDPPYNVAYVGKTKKALTIQNDSMGNDQFREFLQKVFEHAFSVLKPGASFYVWHADSEGYNFRGAVRDNGQAVRQCLIWLKNTMVMCRQDYHWKHEPCLYGWKDGGAHGWYSDRKQTTVLEFDRPSVSEHHPTMKPVALFAYQIQNSTAPQGLVFDNFLGSGTTLVAAEQLGRTCYGIELDPRYCDVIVERWEKLTGKTAERAAR